MSLVLAVHLVLYLCGKKKVEMDLMFGDPILFSLTQGAPDERAMVECGWLETCAAFIQTVSHNWLLLVSISEDLFSCC